MKACADPVTDAAPAVQAGAIDPLIRVLLIEDDLVDELATLRTIERDRLPYRMQVARTMNRARAVLQAASFDVILADYQLGDGTSFDLMDVFGDQLVIFITGAWDPAAAANALRLGVHDYLIKDIEGQYLQLLHYRIATALRQRRLACQLRESETRLQITLAQALQAKAAAEAANAAKSAFLSNISHEIRTPLNALIGVTHLLAESGIDDDQRLLLHKAQLAGRSLLGIVNDVLDLAKIEAGEIALDEAPYQPAALLAEIEAVYAPQAREKGLDFTATTSPDLPAWLHGDSTRLRQVLINLVANALKFTDHGRVEVLLSWSNGTLDRCGLRVRVRDSGIGIERNMQDRLFLPFIQADASTTRRYGGTGLGLSIVKRLAQIMGGEVGVNSAPGVGSEFWVALPQSRPSIDQAASVSRGLRLLDVLVVDDDPLDRVVLTSQVRALGWQALALDGGAALLQELARRAAAGQAPPDVVLVDWQMPGMDGLQALAAMAAMASPSSPRVPPAALVVTAHEREGIGRLDHSGLADHILTKPVGSSALFNAVNDSLARRQGSTDRLLNATRVDAPDTLWLADLRVLLVDDSDINLEVARRLLIGRGAQVRCCTSGHQALDCLRTAPTGFDAVLMDVQMPEMDGLETTRRLRTDLGLLRLPVIALTAGALVEERRRAFDAGMQGFLPKPLDPAQLVRVLRGCVETARGEVLPVADPACQPRDDLAHWPRVEGIDTADAAQRLGRDPALFMSLLRQLLAEFQDLAGLGGSAGAESVPVQLLAARMHKLRGSAGTLGARNLQGLAHAAEASLRLAATHVEGEADAVAALRSVSGALTQLAGASVALLASGASNPTPKAAAAGRATLPPRAEADRMQDLLRQLQGQDLGAFDNFEGLSPSLRLLLGAAAFAALSDAMEELDFARALRLLAPVRPLAPDGPPDGAPALTPAITD